MESIEWLYSVRMHLLSTSGTTINGKLVCVRVFRRVNYRSVNLVLGDKECVIELSEWIGERIPILHISIEMQLCQRWKLALIYVWVGIAESKSMTNRDEQEENQNI